jgi:hypothetical protein
VVRRGTDPQGRNFSAEGFEAIEPGKFEMMVAELSRLQLFGNRSLISASPIRRPARSAANKIYG